MQPLKDYIKAIEANNKGDKEEALSLLTQSIGEEIPNDYIKSSLDKLLMSNDAVLTVILGRIENEKAEQ